MTEIPSADPAARPAPLDDTLVGRTVLMLVSGVGPSDARAALIEKLGRSPEEADAMITQARRRIAVATSYDVVLEIGTAYLRLNDIYTRALKSQDTRTALAAQREINRLLSLDRQPDAQPDAANPNQLPAAEAADRRPREAAAVELFDAIDAALEPLLPADDDATYPERIAQAAALVRRLTKALKRKPTTKPRTKKAARKGRPHAHE